MFIFLKFLVNCGRLSKILWLLKNIEFKINYWIFYVFKYMLNIVYIKKKNLNIWFVNLFINSNL